MRINNMEKPGLYGDEELNLGKRFSLSFPKRRGSMNLGTTNLNTINNLTTTGFQIDSLNNNVATMKIPSNRLLTQNLTSHSLNLVALPYSYHESGDCLRQFFDRAERRLINSI